MIKNTLFLLLSLALSNPAFAGMTAAQKEAGETGVILLKQSDWYDSQPFLNIAAEAGDRDAQYYLCRSY
ncbi:hypothetical protein [Pseudomonas serboccidentalis]|uniref:hypothetical protein n=1 Tax=Pseudomonas serboccidentalis TaxID=2964670 RepID=UPI0039E138A6